MLTRLFWLLLLGLFPAGAEDLRPSRLRALDDGTTQPPIRPGP